MKTGRVIFLNGTSSAGKTSIAAALQERLKEPYMVLSLDNFFHLYPERFLNPTNQAEVDVLMSLASGIISGLHACVAVLARAGNNIVVDHVLEEKAWLQECVERWQDLDVLFVGVRCPLEIAEQREKDRGDRQIGLARYQFDRVHAHGVYDVELDTSVLSIEECVAGIIKALDDSHQPSAFQKLAAGLL